MDIEEKALQNKFATLIGVSEAAVSNYLKKGILEKGGTYQEWILAYCKRQRLQASNLGGEKQTDLAQARIDDLQVKTKLNNLEYLEKINYLIPTELATKTFSGWATYANQEYMNGMELMILEIESKHNITIEKELTVETMQKIIKRIQKHAKKLADAIAETED